MNRKSQEMDTIFYLCEQIENNLKNEIRIYVNSDIPDYPGNYTPITKRDIYLFIRKNMVPIISDLYDRKKKTEPVANICFYDYLYNNIIEYLNMVEYLCELIWENEPFDYMFALNNLIEYII